MADFLLEIGLEEVPARMIAGAEAELGKRVSDLLKRERLLGPRTRRSRPSPRRGGWPCWPLGVLAKAGRYRREVTGPVVEGGFQGWRADGCRRSLCEKGRRGRGRAQESETPKGEYVGATVKRAGRTAAEILIAELPKEVLAIYWAKNMYWRAASRSGLCGRCAGLWR
jgi:glycyl-tRNA synthetase beta chain